MKLFLTPRSLSKTFDTR